MYDYMRAGDGSHWRVYKRQLPCVVTQVQCACRDANMHACSGFVAIEYLLALFLTAHLKQHNSTNVYSLDAQLEVLACAERKDVGTSLQREVASDRRSDSQKYQ